MKKITNWGILGTGKIASKFTSDLALLPEANLYAVGSRSLEKAQAFADKYHFKNAFGTYEALLSDTNVDVVYIATPHAFHCENTLLALENNIAVLCEKPLAINTKEVALMIHKAREKQTFLMEGLWTLYLPHFQKVRYLIEEGILGELLSINANLGFRANFKPESRLFNPALGGGALLDIGIYPLFLAQYFFGIPSDIQAKAIVGTTKVDEEVCVTLTYEKEQMAHLFCSLRSSTPMDAHIYGTKGHIHIPNQWHKPVTHITIFEYATQKKTQYKMPTYALGFIYEAKAIMQYLQNGQVESPIVPLSFSLDLMRTMDAIRQQVGVVYPMD